MENEVAVIEKPRELSVIEVKAQVAKVQDLMHDLMLEGTHYGESFPGDTKKNLLKPGADKLCFMFRLRPDFTQEIKEYPNGHMEVLTRCQIYHIESGQKIADGVGLATTMESKYRWRNAARKCPICGKETIILGKKKYGGGYICFDKKGGCGAKFKEDDPAITSQTVGKVENTDIADTYNTVIKMSKKRAYVDATITACAASDIFSQDAEDFKDTAESLAHEAETETIRNVTEHQPVTAKENTQNTSEQKSESKKIVDDIVAMMMEKTPDMTDFFIDDERQNVKTRILQTNGAIEKLRVIESECRKELEKRMAEYITIPFEDEQVKKNTEPKSTMVTVPQPADDGFVDDIPYEDDLREAIEVAADYQQEIF
jgi:hypothetical protein